MATCLKRPHSHPAHIRLLRSLITFMNVDDGVNVMPFINASLKVARARGADIKLFGSPWSPPGWMKTNGQQVGPCSTSASARTRAAVLRRLLTHCIASWKSL